MGVEIERRFLVKDINTVNNLIEKYSDTKKTIIQDYIYSDALTAIRKRLIIKSGEEKYIYTVKTGRKGLAVNEYESEITKNEYMLLKKDSNRITIEKDRYIIPYIENLKIELDIFHGEYEGVIFAEIEFKTEDQAKKIKIPDWFDIEIGDKISNNIMSKSRINVDEFVNL